MCPRAVRRQSSPFSTSGPPEDVAKLMNTQTVAPDPSLSVRYDIRNSFIRQRLLTHLGAKESPGGGRHSTSVLSVLLLACTYILWTWQTDS